MGAPEENNGRAPASGHLELLEQGIAAARAGDRVGAKARLLRALQLNPRSATAWLWLASMLDRRDEVVRCLERVLEINPQDERAQLWLQRLRPPAPPPRPPRARTVLVVDDSPTVCKIVGLTLEREGHRVLVAADGMQALSKLHETTPDLVLLDISMPHVDGYQLCRLIRDNPATRDLPVIMVSGHGGLLDKLRGRLAGSTDYMIKPFDPAALVRAVEKHTRRRRLPPA